MTFAFLTTAKHRFMQSTAIAMIFVATTLAASGAVLNYNYDSAGRLAAVNYGGASRTNYTYDLNGNLLSRLNAVGQPAPVAGSFTGLVKGNPPAVNNTGTISITLNTSGEFTGKIIVGGKSYTIKGTFDENGLATVTPDGAPFSITLQLDLLDDSKSITGTLNAGADGTVVAHRTGFGKSAPAPANLVGRFTALFEPGSSDASIPQGTGFATLTVNPTGKLRLAGRLADGTRISQGAVLSADGDWPLFALLYKKKGFISGEMSFEALGTSDFSGDAAWIKPATKGPVQSGAFTTNVGVIGSRYTTPAKGQPVLDVANSSPNAHVTTNAGNVDPSLNKPVTLTTANRVEVAAGEPEKLKLSIKTKTGLMKGSFVDDDKTHKFNGVIFQKQNRGAGFFLGTSESGGIDLTPTP
jgi:YD repeat-containing protein